MDAALKKADIKLAAADLKQILKAVSWRVETAPPVIAKVHKPGKAKADPLRGLFEATVDGKPAIVEYEPDSDLRDTEQVPLLEDGGIEAFIRREVLPYTPDAWIKEDATKIGYEVSFTRHFYKPQPLRTLGGDQRRHPGHLEREAEGLLADDHAEGAMLVMAKASKPHAFEPLRRDPFRLLAPREHVSDIRRAEDGSEAMEIAGGKAFEVWINEETDPEVNVELLGGVYRSSQGLRHSGCDQQWQRQARQIALGTTASAMPR